MYDHFGGVYVDIPGHFQLCAGRISGHGCIRSMGGYDHRLAGTGELFYDKVPQREMETPGYFLRGIFAGT